MDLRSLAFAAVCAVGLQAIAQVAPAQSLPRSIRAEGIPPIPAGLDDELDEYRFTKWASFAGWLGGQRAIVYRAGWAGTSQVYLAPSDDEDPIRLTSLDEPVTSVYPHPSLLRLVLTQDSGGDEFYRLLFCDLAGDDIRPFTSRNCRSQNAVWSNSGRLLAFSSDARNDKSMDIYVLTPPRRETGRLLMKSDDWSLVAEWSPDDRRLAIIEYAADFQSSRIHLVDASSGEDETLQVPATGHVKFSDVRWRRDGKGLYWIWNGRSEFRQLALFDLETKVITTLTTAIPWDIDDYDISGDGRMIALLANEDGWAKLHFFDAESGRERLVPALAEGYYAHLVFRPGSQELGFEWSCSQAQSGIYSYDLDTGRRTEWVKPRPGGLKAGRTDEPELVRYPSFDGRMIPAFVQRPSTGSKGQKPYPVLIHIHGGPATQHRPHFSATDDYYLQHLGIAIVSPNVRGSTGYGRTYEELDNGKRREDALRDIGALLDWIATQPDLDVSRVATEGGSYGGFMALAALASYGDRLQAGIDSVGFSSLESFLQNRRPFELAHARFEFGDVRDPEMAAFFRKLSPLTNADKIHKPLLVIHGANDPRVRISEAEQIVSAVRQNGAPVWYIRMDAEGHGVGRIPDLAYEQQAEALFLKRFLLNAGPNAGASAGAEGTARAAGPPGPLEGDPRLGPIGAPSGLVSPRQRAPR